MSNKAAMQIRYQINPKPSTDQFIELLHRSTLAERRPAEDRACMAGMVDNSNLLVSAWDGEKLVGIARSLTDFHYACYLSDLAVDQAYQGLGIGKQLQRLTQAQLGPRCKLILVAAPAANAYYAHLGFSNNPRCWVLEPDQQITR
jgi:ribosomal protein S18 acetylase RimI-like enzyme